MRAVTRNSVFTTTQYWNSPLTGLALNPQQVPVWAKPPGEPISVLVFGLDIKPDIVVYDQ